MNMVSRFTQRLKGWRTLIWARCLVLVGFGLTILSALDVVQLSALLPDKYKPFAPMIFAAIGVITEGLRWITTTPVGDPQPPVAPPPQSQ